MIYMKAVSSTLLAALTGGLLLNSLSSAQKAGPDWKHDTPIRYRTTVKVDGLSDGTYTAYWYAPQKNVWLSVVPVTDKGDCVTLNAPPFDKDLAVKLEPAGESRMP